MATWGPPMDTTFASAMHMFAMTLDRAANDNPIAHFHRVLETERHVSESIVSQYLMHLDSIATLGQPSIAWASINVALVAAVAREHIGTIRALLNVPNWQLCNRSHAVDLATRSDKYAELLPVLLSDVRLCGQSLSAVANDLVEKAHQLSRDGRFKKVLHLLLTLPGFHPRLVWEHALAAAMIHVVEPDVHDWVPPKIFDQDDLMDTAQWQFARARNQHILAIRCSEQLQLAWPVPTRLLLPPACPSLLVGLPDDIHLRLHDFLDLQTLRSIRLTCRTLRHFPMDRFAHHRLVYELRTSATLGKPEYNSAHLQEVIESLGHGGPSVTDYRALVEAVRHLDVRLALKFLCPDEDDIAKGYDLCRASNPRSVDYVVSWALFVLLKTLKARKDSISLVEMKAGGILLRALLMHPMLIEDAWSLTVFYIRECRLALNAVTCLSDSAEDSTFAQAWSQISIYSTTDPATATPNLLIHLIQTGDLLSPLPATLMEELKAPNPSLANVSPITRVFVLLCTISYVPSTFTTLMDTFSSPLATPTKRILLSTLHQQPDPALYFSHVLFALAPVPFEILRSPIAERAKRAGNEDVMKQLLPHLTISDVYSLLSADAHLHRYPPVVKMNALVLTHWLQRVGETEAQMDQRRGEEKVEQVVPWRAAGKLVRLIREWLQEMEGKGDQTAGERLSELVAAWDAIPHDQQLRAVQPAMQYAQKKGCWIQ